MRQGLGLMHGGGGSCIRSDVHCRSSCASWRGEWREKRMLQSAAGVCEQTRGRIPQRSVFSPGLPVPRLRCGKLVARVESSPSPALESMTEGEETQTSWFKRLVDRWNPPRWLWRGFCAVTFFGLVIKRGFQLQVHKRNLTEQLTAVGPRSLGVALLTASFVGMVFTIQFVREFAKLGLTRSVGGVLALALCRELTPVVTSIILAGRVGSAFAAELGTMQVSEQTDTLRVLGSDPVDYLVTPRVLACMIAMPILNILCFATGMAASTFLAETVYSVNANVILDSAARAITLWDIVSSEIKATIFGGIIAVISCAWGFTTSGGAKGVGESTTSAVVISLVCIFIADFFLSYLFFQGQGDALKQCM